MKMPKFVLTIAGQEFVVPDNAGVATLINIMADAIPVDANLHRKEITLRYTKPGDERLLAYVTEVRIQKIPAGVTWKQENETGEVVEVRPVTKAPKALPAPKAKTLRLKNGSSPRQLESGRGPALQLNWWDQS